MIDISDLCCWVSDMLRGDAATHQRTSKTRTAMQHEIGGRFGVDDEDAGNNLFGWLVRMQRGGSQTPHGMGCILIMYTTCVHCSLTVHTLLLITVHYAIPV